MKIETITVECEECKKPFMAFNVIKENKENINFPKLKDQPCPYCYKEINK